MDANYELSVLSTKKKRGRPRKADTVLLPAEVTALGVLTPPSEHKYKKPRITNSDASQAGDVKQSLVGQPVHGVVDGSFDAGYLVSVRVGGSENVYRGVVFGPGLSIPLAKDIDVAAKVKSTKRDETVPVTPPSPPSPAPAEPSQGREMVAIPPAFNGPTDLRPISQQEMLSPLLQQGFMHPAASFQSAQGFAARGYSNPYHLIGTDYGYGNSPFGAGGQGDHRGSS